MEHCFLCDIQEKDDLHQIAENRYGYARLDEFPVSKGHSLVALKRHEPSYFRLTPDEVMGLHALVQETEEVLSATYHPDGFTIGVNEGKAAGQSVDHVHIHLIPRYQGDVEVPLGGVRNIIPGKGMYKIPLFKDDCDFCREFGEVDDETDIRADKEYAPAGKRVLYESQHFVVFPTLGHLVEGYLLLGSRLHYPCIGSLPHMFTDELEILQEKVRKVLYEHYSSPVFFEHGPVSRTKTGGCCVDHLHLHAVPLDIHLADEVRRYFPSEEVDSLSSLSQYFDKGIPYFYVEDNTGKFVFPLHEAVPSQFMRKIIAKQVDKEDLWDWCAYQGREEMHLTLEKLKGAFT